jgi:hypothetical protein
VYVPYRVVWWTVIRGVYSGVRGGSRTELVCVYYNLIFFIITQEPLLAPSDLHFIEPLTPVMG